MNRIRRIALNQRGLTVAEVLIAVAIITVGLMALAWVMPIPMSQITQSNRKTAAVFLTQEKLEQIKNAQWTATPTVDNLGGAASNGLAAVSTFPDESYTSIAGYPSYRRTVRIKDCSVAGGCGTPAVVSADLRRVTVSVFFRPMTGAGSFNLVVEDGVQVTTLIAKR